MCLLLSTAAFSVQWQSSQSYNMASKTENTDYLALFNKSLPSTAQVSLAQTVGKIPAWKKSGQMYINFWEFVGTRANYHKKVQHRTHQETETLGQTQILASPGFFLPPCGLFYFIILFLFFCCCSWLSLRNCLGFKLFNMIPLTMFGHSLSCTLKRVISSLP